MEQGTSSNTHIIHSSPSAVFTDDEIDVAYILLHLPNPIFYSEYRYRFSVKWGNKRKRSAIKLIQSPSLRVDMKKQKKHKAKNKASSPATPLSFSPSESDGKSKHFSKKVSKKRTREEWMGIIDGLMQQRKMDTETTKGYYKLKASNLGLKKAKKQEMRNSHLEMNKSLDCGVKLDPPIMQSSLFQNQDHPQIHNMIKQQPSIVDQTAYISSHSHSSGQIPPLKFKRTGTHGFPDLNVVAAKDTLGVDASHPLYHFRVLAENRARAAEARRRRRVRIKEMKNSSTTAIKPQ